MVLLDVDHQTDWLFQVAFIAYARDTFDLVRAYESGDALDHAIAELLIRNLCNDDARTILDRLDMRACTDDDRATTSSVSLMNPVTATNNAAGRKIRTRDDL